MIDQQIVKIFHTLFSNTNEININFCKISSQFTTLFTSSVTNIENKVKNQNISAVLLYWQEAG
jgi:hypothetical protein